MSFINLDLESDWYQSMCALHSTIFRPQGTDAIEEELSSKPNFLILVALANQQVVGYKIGYQERRTRFYSWLGGVHPEYRGQGIASELMLRQHEWCRSQGYTVVRTQTKNKWRSMLILNLRHGFDVVGTYTDKHGEPKIILEKRIESSALHPDNGR
ncbi:GNAT family N-acetyltransferase [Alicyclobacillus sp. SO9]|uniref:GNAT family N-acetyltransferase n=1 Tax=Alicyclobacillus sp. SO9 TaxID=2665646 RepID=UPI0018E754B5|nr:GNAT family N-acetyltransferase [Alicyclobacillus sp. SO9]QQE81454.1 GNAT family N-acetyltransferase [Alicyclobacillus sp. SO9]